jgi:hypothetical protein
MSDTPFTDEQFLRRLADADPVDPTTLPTADDPTAARLLDTILATADAGPGHAAEAAHAAHAVDAAVATPADPGRPGWIGRSRLALVAVAAAVLVLVGAVAVLAPDSTPAAVAEVRAAAATTASADTGHIETTFALHVDDEGTGHLDGGAADLAGRAAVDYAGSDLALSIQLDTVPSEVERRGLTELVGLEDIRLVDDVVYFRQGEQWLAVETGGLLGDLVVQVVDPRTVLDTVKGLSEATEVGPAEVDGTATTHFRSVVDLGDESLAEAGWMAVEGMDVAADGEVTIDLFVDADGALRRFELTGDVRPDDGSPGQGTFDVVTTFSGLGAEHSIEAPAGATTFDPLAGLGGLDDLDG